MAVVLKDKNKIKFIQGDLLAMAKQGEFDVVVHGCNCFHSFGSGIAWHIKNAFPSAYEADKNKSVYGSKEKLGTYTVAKIDGFVKPFEILNAYTQYQYGGGRDNFSYETFDVLLEKIKQNYPNAHIGMPLIGCGLAGGNIRQILSKLIEHFSDENWNGKLTLVEINQDFINKKQIHTIFNNLKEEYYENV